MPLNRLSQKGAGTLLLTVLLLFAASMTLLYLNRSMVFEQKTSANQMRSTMALEAAEAGLEWAVGMLNNPEIMNAACTSGTGTDIPFRKKYIQFSTATPRTLPTITAARPGCRIDGIHLACSCPESGTAALSATSTPSFTVSFSAVPLADDSTGESVRITSTGCTASNVACTAATSGQSDATATVSVIAKLRPLLRAGPASALTCGAACRISGSYDIVNQSIASNGILINAGSTIAPGNAGARLISLPGIPGANALVANDSTLATLSGFDSQCNNSAVFNAYFGTTIESFASAPTTKTITCSSPSACGQASIEAYTKGWRAFYFAAGVDYNNSSGFTTLGTTADPVIIVTPENFNITGNITINGVIFSNSANVNDLGTGTANINGAMLTCGNYDNNGSGTLTYIDHIVNGPKHGTSIAVKLPGSWKDFQ